LDNAPQQPLWMWHTAPKMLLTQSSGNMGKKPVKQLPGHSPELQRELRRHVFLFLLAIFFRLTCLKNTKKLFLDSRMNFFTIGKKIARSSKKALLLKLNQKTEHRSVFLLHQ
jgi:hypothetical protein